MVVAVVVVGVKGFVNIKQEFVVLIRIRLTSHPVPDDDTKDRTLVRRFLGGDGGSDDTRREVVWF